MSKDQNPKVNTPVKGTDEEIPISKLSVNFSAVIGLIVAIGSIFWGAFNAYADIDKTLTVTASEVVHLKDKVDDIRQLLESDIVELEEDVKIVQAKMESFK